MKGQIVKNHLGEPRLKLELESEEEIALFERLPMLMPVMAGRTLMLDPDGKEVWVPNRATYGIVPRLVVSEQELRTPPPVDGFDPDEEEDAGDAPAGPEGP